MNGVVALSNYRLDKYASGQQETWKKNTASCKYWYDSRKENGYKDAHGNACKPDEKNTHAPTGFVVVYPTGLLDRGTPHFSPPPSKSVARRTYHWEDDARLSRWGVGRKRIIT